MQEYRIRPREAALEHITAYLAARGLKPGDRLPSEREMCQMWDLNRCTLRSALSRMEREGLLTARRGAGLFVAGPKMRRNLQNLKSFSQEAALQGRQTDTRVLSFCSVECDKTFSRRFRCLLGTPLWKLVRLRSMDGRPVMIETAFFLKDRFPGMEGYDFEKQSLFAVMEEDYQAVPTRGEEKISITQANGEEAALLEVEKETPLFWLVTQTYDADGQLLEYCRTVARGDRVVLTSVLERKSPT